LAGVPVAIKDNVAVTGEVATDGTSAHTPPVASADHPVVQRLRAAGAVIVGITRVPELCVYSATDGPGTVTRNPWDTAYSAAGSSGGSAAAVASACVPIAHGNDGMGSLRLPAAANGLVTLKPGSGVIPAELGADSWSGMAENGALTTTVGDLAAAFAVLAGDPAYAEAPSTGGPGRPLRVALSTMSPIPGARLDAAGRAAVDAVVAELRAAGHTVLKRTPLITPPFAVGVFARWFAGADDDARALGIRRRDLEPRNRVHARLGAAARRARLIRPGAPRAFRERMERFFSDVDVLLTPIVTGKPLPARPWHERGFVANFTANARWAPWAAPWNFAGLPALVLPAGPGRDGLPTAVQFVGPAGSEARLLWLAGELERRMPWRRHAPVFDPQESAGAPAD
jgi:amidase